MLEIIKQNKLDKANIVKPQIIRRVNSEDKEILYPIYYEAVSKGIFLNSNKRQEILEEMQEAIPELTRTQLQRCLNEYQREYWENIYVINREGLRNKIIIENELMKEQLYHSNERDSVKMRVINEINKTTASIGQLLDIAPSIEIKINTSINEDELAKSINKSNVVDVKENKGTLEQ